MGRIIPLTEIVNDISKNDIVLLHLEGGRFAVGHAEVITDAGVQYLKLRELRDGWGGTHTSIKREHYRGEVKAKVLGYEVLRRVSEEE